MPENDKLIQALKQALTVDANNVALRTHLGDLLFESGDIAEAEKEYRQALLLAADDREIKFSLAKAFFYQEKWMMALVVLEELMKLQSTPAEAFLLAARAYLSTGQMKDATIAYQRAIQLDSSLSDSELDEKLTASSDNPAEDKEPHTPKQEDNSNDRVRVRIDDWETMPTPEVEHSHVSFDDVGGMDKLKEEIRMKIIHPLTNPEIYQAYGKTIGGGILMYGPPGCGKTHLARATAGEVNAYFLSIGIHEVLNMYLGESENNLHKLFETARRYTPCVLFIDEIDALGASRTDMRRSAGRHLINQLLSELDGIDMSNEGVLILAATNAPWHLDSALRRPGRFDRIIFVPPPDLDARAAILEVMLKKKPIEEGIDYHQIARKTDGFSGADLKGLINITVEDKLRDAMTNGVPMPIETKDLLKAAKSLKPTTQDWFATARNYALYANQSGLYDDILKYMRIDDESNLFSRMKFWRDQ